MIKLDAHLVSYVLSTPEYEDDGETLTGEQEECSYDSWIALRIQMLEALVGGLTPEQIQVKRVTSEVVEVDEISVNEVLDHPEERPVLKLS